MSAAAGSVIDELWIRLGIKPDGSGLREVKTQVNEAKESLISAGGALKAFVAGFALKEVADIGSTFEQNRIQIAGFLSALSNGSMDYKSALQPAADVIQQITKDAAILPGEAEEYIEVFKAGYPFVKDAMPGGSLGDITKFTNQLTAIGKTFGLDAGLIAREFDHMLSPGKGMASLRLPLFRQLMNFMPKLANGARVTAEAFNAMTAPQRLQLLQGTFDKLQPMLDASANSFDAMWGAAKSALKQITRIATAPLFKGLKEGLDAINSALYDTNGKLTPFGQNIVDVIAKATQYLTQFLAMGGHLLMWFAHTKAGAMTLKTVLALVGAALAGLALEKTIASFKKLILLVTNFSAILKGGLVGILLLIAEDLYTFSQGGESVTGMIVNKMLPALTQMKIAIGAIGAAFLAASVSASPLLGVLVILAAIGLEVYTLATHWDEFVGGMKATWDTFVQSIEDGANSIATALGASPIFNTKAKQEADLDARYEKQRAILRSRRQPIAGAIPAGATASEPSWAPNLSWSPTDSLGPGPTAPAAAAPVVRHQKIDIHVNGAKDPKTVAKEVNRELVRASQSQVKM